MSSVHLRHGERLPVMTLVLVTLLIASACSRVAQADLVGAWTLTDRSRGYLPADLRSTVTHVDLASDGTFAAVDLPDKRIESTGLVVFTKSGRGTWKIVTLGGTDKVQLIFADGAGAQFEISTFLESEPKLYYFLSDPDSGKRLELVRSR